MLPHGTDITFLRRHFHAYFPMRKLRAIKPRTRSRGVRGLLRAVERVFPPRRCTREKANSCPTAGEGFAPEEEFQPFCLLLVESGIPRFRLAMLEQGHLIGGDPDWLVPWNPSAPPFLFLWHLSPTGIETPF